MGVLFFMIFLAILFSIAGFFIIVNIIIIAVWKLRKREGKNPQKWWLILPTIFLVVNIIVAFLPVGFIGFLCLANVWQAIQPF